MSKRNEQSMVQEKKNSTLRITPVTEFKNKTYPKTAACLVIGDEVLNGKTADTNSHVFAKYCFEHGIELKRIEVISDDEDEIIEAVRRLSDNFDFVVTSGGLGSTHDDITYPSLAKAYNLPLKYHQETFDRLIEYAPILKRKRNKEEFLESLKRMATFPDPCTIVYPNETLWIPIVIVNENIHLLPGIPSLFKALLFGFSKYLKIRVNNNGENFIRKFVRTFQAEGFIAPILYETQEKVKDLGIKIGSYPKWTDDKQWVTTVSFLSRENNKDKIDELCKEVAEKIDGIIVDNDDDDDVDVDVIVKNNGENKL